MNVRFARARKVFVDGLKGVTDPERKRKIIGRTFIEVFEKEAKKIKGAEFLGQGTLYPDLIESRSAFGGPSAVIKSHHNVGGLPKRMKLKLVEPLKHLFKDEVRLLGKELGLSDDVVWRQPFPGPGLAVRIIGEVTEKRLTILRKADAVLMEEIRAGELLPEALAVLRRPPADQERRDHGGPADLRKYHRHPGGDERGRHDGGLGAAPPRPAEPHLQPDHQRGARGEPGRLRHQLEAAEHD